jgi:hypothetical protein
MTGLARERILDAVTNVAIAVLAAVMSIVLIRDYAVPRVLAPAAAPAPAAASQIPSPLHLAGLDFTKSDRTLLFVLSSQCPFCRQSEGFYRTLAGNSSQYKNLQFAAALPQPEPEGRAYLHQAGIRISQVTSTDLGTIGVEGTPTLVLVDSRGNVLQYWTGKLAPEGEKQVMDAIGSRP